MNTECATDDLCLTKPVVTNSNYTAFEVDDLLRLSITALPQSNGTTTEQTIEALSIMASTLSDQSIPMQISSQNIFIRSANDIPLIEELLRQHYADAMPATAFLLQPPCDGQDVVIEAWAIGGRSVSIDFISPQATSVEYNGMKWTYVNGITSPTSSNNAYEDTQHVFNQMADTLKSADSCFSEVTRVWLYQSGITQLGSAPQKEEVEAYRELNRSRTDIFDKWEKAGQMPHSHTGEIYYPPGTGIGMTGTRGLTSTCLALKTDRDDVKLIPLENPLQTPAFDYERRFSVKSPKFSRAMAMITNNQITTWVSGTASIIDSESIHIDDIEKQTEQTIANIQTLICPENLERHGFTNTGSQLSDLARIRVYVKRQKDYEKCRAVCENHFGTTPVVYVIADVCRPELLVEIEAVAFSAIEK